MSFGTATISAPAAPCMGRGARRYDCGRHGKLNRAQIAALAGISMGAAYYRAVKLGLRGEALIAGTAATRKRNVGSVARTPCVVIACRLARAFPGKAPTWRQVQGVVPMSEQAAKRWSRAMEAAL